MTADGLTLILLPVGLGLLGFVEPCSIGSALVFIKVIEGKPAAVKLAQVSVFALTRAAFIGVLGAGAAALGAAFFGFQRGAWALIGLLYVAIGLLYLAGRGGVAIGPRLSRLSGLGGSAGLGVLFGLNVPACAAPLLFALLGTAAGGAGALAEGFLSLALFGIALSAPLVAAVLLAPARRVLDRLAGLSRRAPTWTGLVMIALGAWSIGFGVFVSLQPLE